MVEFKLFCFLNENLNLVTVKLTSVLQDILSFTSFFFININAANGSMLNHFESTRISFNQNSELFLSYALVILVSFLIGVVVYLLTHSKAKNKN